MQLLTYVIALAAPLALATSQAPDNACSFTPRPTIPPQANELKSYGEFRLIPNVGRLGDKSIHYRVEPYTSFVEWHFTPQDGTADLSKVKMQFTSYVDHKVIACYKSDPSCAAPSKCNEFCVWADANHGCTGQIDAPEIFEKTGWDPKKEQFALYYVK